MAAEEFSDWKVLVQLADEQLALLQSTALEKVKTLAPDNDDDFNDQLAEYVVLLVTEGNTVSTVRERLAEFLEDASDVEVLTTWIAEQFSTTFGDNCGPADLAADVDGDFSVSTMIEVGDGDGHGNNNNGDDAPADDDRNQAAADSADSADSAASAGASEALASPRPGAVSSLIETGDAASRAPAAGNAQPASPKVPDLRDVINRQRAALKAAKLKSAKKKNTKTNGQGQVKAGAGAPAKRKITISSGSDKVRILTNQHCTRL